MKKLIKDLFYFFGRYPETATLLMLAIAWFLFTLSFAGGM